MSAQKNRMIRNRLLATSVLCMAVLVPASSMRAQNGSGDVLYIGDGGDNTIKRFDAANGTFLDAQAGSFVLPGSAGLRGPRGIIIDKSLSGDLIVVNQNTNMNFAGEILEYSIVDGHFIKAIVPCQKPTGRTCDINAPFAPRGIVRGFPPTPDRFFVANLGKKEIGSVSQFDENGGFLGDLDFASFIGDIFGEYHPRGVVVGPDGNLYVSLVGNLGPNDPHFDPVAGFIVRFSKDGMFRDVFASDATCPGLHRPEGLAFGPDRRLYVASFRAGTSDTDKIVILNADGTFDDKIDLDVVGEPRTYAQALLFGPNGRLFVPINNTGEVRRYDVRTKRFQSLVQSGGPLTEPWYLTFGKTDSGTLAYKP
jgi:hypothetical protein